MDTKQHTIETWNRMWRLSGKWAHARKSCNYRGLGGGPACVEGPGWESAAHDRQPTEGWEYGVEEGCGSKGGPGASAWTWYRMMKRRIAD